MSKLINYSLTKNNGDPWRLILRHHSASHDPGFSKFITLILRIPFTYLINQWNLVASLSQGFVLLFH